MKTYTISKAELVTVAGLVTETASLDGLSALFGPTALIQPVSVDVLAAGWVGAEWVRAVAHYQDDASVGYESLEALSADHEWTADVSPEFSAAEPGIEILTVEAEESDDVDEGAAYWVTASIGGTEYRLYAAPTQPTGRLAACGSSVDDWCPGALVSRYGAQVAVALGTEAIAMARI